MDDEMGPVSPRGTGWRPVPSPAADPAAELLEGGADPAELQDVHFDPDLEREPLPPPPMGPQREMLRGQARAVSQRFQHFGDSPEEVLTFRLERYDERGDRQQPVLVELRGRQFEGALHEGDHVSVSGSWRDGRLCAERIHNETTNSQMRAKQFPGLWVAAVVVVVMLAVVGVGFALFQNASDDSRRDAELQFEEERSEMEERSREALQGACEEARSRGLDPSGCD